MCGFEGREEFRMILVEWGEVSSFVFVGYVGFKRFGVCARGG